MVHTAVCVAQGGTHRTELDSAAVAMHPIDADLLERYLATGESLDKAGGYAVQGEAAMFVERVTGHLTTVVGLPVRLVEGLLGRSSDR
jgi:septum formation protein